jgi:eukaryotic-like serine/threonine-protein kinase
VISQNPGPGDRMVKGRAITLILSLGPERVAVPDVIGTAYAVAAAELKSKKLKPVRGEDKYDATTPAGNVLAVDPAVDTELKPGSKVTLTVSKGKPPVTVPELVGRNVGEAQGQLGQLGLIADVEQVDSPDKPAGEVLDQDPKPGTGVEKNTHVKLKVSKGPALQVLPRVVDQPCQQAQQQLQQAGFQVSVQGIPTATVRIQNPGENTPVPPGTGVTITCF